MIRIEDASKVVVSFSGGLDSTTLLYLAVNKLGADNVYALSFDYNQRHSVELELAKKTCQKLGVKHKIINLAFLGELAANVSAMVKGSVPTPRAEDPRASSIVPTYVPFRNMILSGITLSFAESIGADAVALGVQYGDYYTNEAWYYWDCSKQFTETIQQLANLNNKHQIHYITPFVSLAKEDIVKLGSSLGVDFSNTRTCYTDDTIACGECPSCVARRAAFQKAGVIDPLPYKK